MKPESLTPEERRILLELARQSIQLAVRRQPLPKIDLNQVTPKLREQGAAFVTLTIHGNLRGCIGALEAYQPLVLDVQEHAVAAALEDYRFRPVSEKEIPLLEIEISRLTPPVPLEYGQPADLPGKLRPGIDGVILRDGAMRATFLPQVWEQLPEPEEFLSHLCSKMGAPSSAWQRHMLRVWTYQVEEFKEEVSGG